MSELARERLEKWREDRIAFLSRRPSGGGINLSDTFLIEIDEVLTQIEQDARNMRDARQLISQIVAHEGHDDINHCHEAMLGTARAALVILDRRP